MLSKRVRFSYVIDDNGLSDVNIDFVSRFHVIGPQLLVHRMEQRVYKTGTETIPALQSSTLIWQPRSLFLLCDTKLACCSISTDAEGGRVPLKNVFYKYRDTGIQ